MYTPVMKIYKQLYKINKIENSTAINPNDSQSNILLLHPLPSSIIQYQQPLVTREA